MPGAGSCLDTNDWHMLNELSDNIRRLAEAIEEQNADSE